jgi:signal transduction histidine kinase
MNEKTILLVDDEEGIRKVLGLTLSDAGYTVHTAESGEEALALLDRVHPAMVLTDIKMPGMDGIELLGHIKERAPDTEVIMITGHGDIDLAIRSIQFQATDFVTKPINDAVLEIALNRALERLRMRRQLRAYTENLEQLVEEKSRALIAAERMAAIGQTVAGLSHAIKNVAGGLDGCIFMLEKGMELDRRQYLEQGWAMLKANVEKVRNLSMDMLRYAKDAVAQKRPCDPAAPAREVLDLLSPRAAEEGVALSADLPAGLPEVDMDPEGVHRCLLNLMTNALDACAECPEGSRRVRLALRRPPEGGVAYEVADSGPGLDPEAKGQLFQSFFSTKGDKGTGIGLMSSRKIAEAHGGSLTLENGPEGGAVARLILPGPQPSSPAGRIDEFPAIR